MVQVMFLKNIPTGEENAKKEKSPIRDVAYRSIKRLVNPNTPIATLSL